MFTCSAQSHDLLTEAKRAGHISEVPLAGGAICGTAGQPVSKTAFMTQPSISDVPAGPRHPLDRAARIPRTCIWEITSACNLSCLHCDNHSSRPALRELDRDRLLETCGELAELGCRCVDVTGGEPMLSPHWQLLCQSLSSRNIDVVLVTNGTLLDAATVQQATRSGVRTISVSIDGLKPTHDATRRFVRGTESAFEAAVAGIRCASGRVPVSVITQVNRTNLGELGSLGRFLGELGVSRWQLQLAIPIPKLASLAVPYTLLPGDLESLTAFILKAAEEPGIPMIHTSDTIGYATPAEAVLRRKASGPGIWLGCVAGIRSVAIKFDGTVRGCSLLPSDFDAGNLHEESLATIWNDSSRFAYSTQFDSSHLCGECKRCRYGSICRAGCTTMAYHVTGTTGDNPYCLRRVREHSPCNT